MTEENFNIGDLVDFKMLDSGLHLVPRRGVITYKHLETDTMFMSYVVRYNIDPTDEYSHNGSVYRQSHNLTIVPFTPQHRMLGKGDFIVINEHLPYRFYYIEDLNEHMYLKGRRVKVSRVIHPDPGSDRQTVYFVDSIFGGQCIIQEHEINQLATARLNPTTLIHQPPYLPQL